MVFVAMHKFAQISICTQYSISLEFRIVYYNFISFLSNFDVNGTKRNMSVNVVD